ncbi:MAG: SDR family NAD(P)-dependent oxidoreductase [Chloroflexi bacterium]|nr:SDR family NAD(P)-dependent oxidoreductase [Chloroflexota bacterium]MBI3740554.1 SDR family NAD(P)-dependent oxidoreductase [Chloroflexota bacterium]
MHILVTGGAGFIGSHTIDLLLQKGHRVRVLDNLMPPVHRDQHLPAYIPRDVEFIHGDVRDHAAWERALENIDAVFHLAAYQDYLTDLSKFFHINTVGTALLYEIIVTQKLPVKKIVVASSQSVYGEGKYECAEHGVQYPPLRAEEQLKRREWDVRCPLCARKMKMLITDEARVNPHNQYAMSKYTQEMLALNFGKRYAIPTVALRYSITQGPRQSFRNAYSGILRIFTTRLLFDRAPIAYEDGAQLRDYVSVHDVARANVLVFEDARANYKVYNVGGGRAVTVNDYAQLLARIIGKNIAPQQPGHFRFGDTRHIVSDISNLRALGWEPRVALEDIAREYVEWARAQPDVRDYYEQAEREMLMSGTLRVSVKPPRN